MLRAVVTDIRPNGRTTLVELVLSDPTRLVAELSPDAIVERPERPDVDQSVGRQRLEQRKAVFGPGAGHPDPIVGDATNVVAHDAHHGRVSQRLVGLAEMLE